MKLFADDVKIYIEVNDIADNLMLQRGLDNLKRWCVKWQLNISIGKCAVLHLGSYNKTFNNYNIDTVQLPNTCEVKDLGVTVDQARSQDLLTTRAMPILSSLTAPFPK